MHHPIVTDTRSLLWIVNQNTITPHVWSSRAPDLYHPDICVFDLDPSEDDPDALRAAALGVRELLEELGLPSWVKTSGSKGFHIVVPLDGKADTGVVSGFAHHVGAMLVKLAPDHLTQEFSKADRGKRISSIREGMAAARRGPRPTPCARSRARRSRRRARGRKSNAATVGPQTFTLRDDGCARRGGRRPVVGRPQAGAVPAACHREAATNAACVRAVDVASTRSGARRYVEVVSPRG